MIIIIIITIMIIIIIYNLSTMCDGMQKIIVYKDLKLSTIFNNITQGIIVNGNGTFSFIYKLHKIAKLKKAFTIS